MEMYQIRYFLAVARTLNFSRAAEECHVSQPSLSRAIKNLEDELGGLLFRRERSLSHMTELGRAMLPVLQKCYESSNEAKELAAAFRKGRAPPLRIALSWSVNIMNLIAALGELQRAFPDLELKFFRGSDDDVTENIKNGDSEIALTGQLDTGWERLDSVLLFSEPLQLVLARSHPWFGREEVTLADLRGHRLLFRKHCGSAARLRELLSEQGIELLADSEVASDFDIVTMLNADLGLSILPESAVADVSCGFVPIADLDIECPVYVHSVAGRQRSASASAIIRLLRSADWTERRNPLPPGIKPNLTTPPPSYSGYGQPAA